MKRIKGFTLVELLVVVAIIALLVSILLPSLSRAKEQVRQTLCTSNLKGISSAWAMYASSYNDSPPLLLTKEEQKFADYLSYCNLKMGDECTRADLGDGAQQILCLLVNANTVPWGMFLCPSMESEEADRTGSGRRYGLGEVVGGEAVTYCDYGVQLPYAHNPDGANINFCPLTKNMDGGIVIVGDRAPGSMPYSSWNLVEWSPNHPEHGESLLYVGGNVRFSKDEGTVAGTESRNLGGWGGNNVYTQDYWNDKYVPDPVLEGVGRGSLSPYSSKDTILWAWTRETW